MSNFITQHWLLNRRHFLRGAGAALALPLLDAMIPMTASAAAAVEKPGAACSFTFPMASTG